MRQRSEAENLCDFQWETGSFLQHLHLESELCCDRLILKLVEKALLSSSTTGTCPGSPLQLQCNSPGHAFVFEWLWSVSICFLYMWFDLMSFPSAASHGCLYSFLLISLCFGRPLFPCIPLHESVFCSRIQAYSTSGAETCIFCRCSCAPSSTGAVIQAPIWTWFSLLPFTGCSLHVRSGHHLERCWSSFRMKGAVEVENAHNVPESWPLILEDTFHFFLQIPWFLSFVVPLREWQSGDWWPFLLLQC